MHQISIDNEQPGPSTTSQHIDEVGSTTTDNRESEVLLILIFCFTSVINGHFLLLQIIYIHIPQICKFLFQIQRLCALCDDGTAVLIKMRLDGAQTLIDHLEKLGYSHKLETVNQHLIRKTLYVHQSCRMDAVHDFRKLSNGLKT